MATGDIDRLKELNRKRVQRYRQRQREGKIITPSSEIITSSVGILNKTGNLHDSFASEPVMDADTLPESALQMLKSQTDWLISIGAESLGSPNVQTRLQAMRRAMRPTIPG